MVAVGRARHSGARGGDGVEHTLGEKELDQWFTQTKRFEAMDRIMIALEQGQKAIKEMPPQQVAQFQANPKELLKYLGNTQEAEAFDVLGRFEGRSSKIGSVVASVKQALNNALKTAGTAQKDGYAPARKDGMKDMSKGGQSANPASPRQSKASSADPNNVAGEGAADPAMTDGQNKTRQLMDEAASRSAQKPNDSEKPSEDASSPSPTDEASTSNATKESDAASQAEADTKAAEAKAAEQKAAENKVVETPKPAQKPAEKPAPPAKPDASKDAAKKPTTTGLNMILNRNEFGPDHYYLPHDLNPDPDKNLMPV